MKLSIIIPTIGRETLLDVVKALLLSKKSIQYSIEILVVYDGNLSNLFKSAADTPELKILNQVQDDNQVALLDTKQKAYAGGARNVGLENATGDIIVFLGDDTIPASDWLQKTIDWHKAHPDMHEALLGRVAWVDRLAGDRFHQWMDRYAQFDYARLDRGFAPGWHHFYTSNVSVKRVLLEDEKFHEAFRGWGFEDAEFGYRLAKKGMQLHYQGDTQVFHDDEQSVNSLIKRTQQAHKNALVFELLHPEVQILPRRFKRWLLQILIWLVWPFSFIPEIRWWRLWKITWLNGDPSARG